MFKKANVFLNTVSEQKKKRKRRRLWSMRRHNKRNRLGKERRATQLAANIQKVSAYQANVEREKDNYNRFYRCRARGYLFFDRVGVSRRMTVS